MLAYTFLDYEPVPFQVSMPHGRDDLILLRFNRHDPFRMP